MLGGKRRSAGAVTVALATALVVASLSLGQPIAAQSGPQASLKPSSGPPGIGVQVTGSGFFANEPVQVHWDDPKGEPEASGKADGNGNVSLSFAVPSGASPGQHNVYVCHDGNSNAQCENYGDPDSFYRGDEPAFTVTSPATTPTTAAPTTTVTRAPGTPPPATTTTTEAGPAPPSSAEQPAPTGILPVDGLVGFDPGVGVVGPGILGGRATFLPLTGEPPEGFQPRCLPPPQATVVDFDDVAAGTDVAEQYADLGVHLQAGTVQNEAGRRAFAADDRPLRTEDASAYGTASTPNAVHHPNDPARGSVREAVRITFDEPQRLIGVYVGDPDDWAWADFGLGDLDRSTGGGDDPYRDYVAMDGQTAVTTCMLLLMPEGEATDEVVLWTGYADSNLRFDRLFFSDDPAYSLPDVTEGFVRLSDPRGEVDVTDPIALSGSAGPTDRPGDTAERVVTDVSVVYRTATGSWVTREAEVAPPGPYGRSSSWRLGGVALPEGTSTVRMFASGPGVVARGSATIEAFTPEGRLREVEGTYDLRPMALEVVQAVRGPILAMRPGHTRRETAIHVAGKQTTVRAYGRVVWHDDPPDGVDAVPTDAWLLGFRRGRLLPGGPLRGSPNLVDLEERSTALGPLNDLRLERTASWNFSLPLSWTAAGDLDLFLWINPPGPAHRREGGPDAGLNHLRLQRVRFEPVDRRDVYLYLADFHWRQDGPTQNAVPTLGELGQVISFWEAAFPVPYTGLLIRDLRVKRWAQRPCDGEVLVDPVADFCSRPAVEGVPEWQNSIIAAEQARAIARGREVFVPLLFSPDSPIGCTGRAGFTTPMFHAGACGATVAQEAAHSLGVFHLSNAHREELDGTPFTERNDDDHAELEAGAVGWDAVTGQPVAPGAGRAHRHDFMSYGWRTTANAWVTLDTWRRVAASLRAANPRSPRTGAPIRAISATTQAEEEPDGVGSLLVTVAVNDGEGDDGSAQLGSVIAVDVEAPETDGGDDYQIVLVDAGGEDLLMQGVDAPRRTHGVFANEAHVLVPALDGVARVELRQGGTVVDSFDAADVEPLDELVADDAGSELFALIRSPRLGRLVAPNGSARFDAEVGGADPAGVAITWLLDGEEVGDTATLYLAGADVGRHQLTLRAEASDEQVEVHQVVVVDHDADGDGLGDSWEDDHGLDPDDPSDAHTDHDGDELAAWQEQQHDTDPDEPDTDGDDYSDAVEVAGGSDPTDADSAPQALHTMLGEPVPTMSSRSAGGSAWPLLLGVAVLLAAGGAGALVVRRRRRA